MPKCNLCDKTATRWDGGGFSIIVKKGVVKVAPPTWLCNEHDPYHKSFDFPQTLEDALEVIVELRQKLHLATSMAWENKPSQKPSRKRKAP